MYKHLQSGGTVSWHCTKKHSCCLEPYMPDRPTFPAAVSSQPYRAACALVPHPEAPVAHSWQDWCTACPTSHHFGPH